MDAPKRYKLPPISAEPACAKAWEELIEKQGYPMTCVGSTARGYFSAGWEAAMKAISKKFWKPSEMPKG